jgi:hypothetical protein
VQIIRPEQPIKKVATEKVIVGNEIITQEYRAGIDEDGVMCQERRVISKELLIDDNTGKDQTIENLMDEIIKQKDDKIQVTISLTKRQYDLYLKKGGESWIKKVITGQQIKKKSTKKR